MTVITYKNVVNHKSLRDLQLASSIIYVNYFCLYSCRVKVTTSINEVCKQHRVSSVCHIQWCYTHTHTHHTTTPKMWRVKHNLWRVLCVVFVTLSVSWCDVCVQHHWMWQWLRLFFGALATQHVCHDPYLTSTTTHTQNLFPWFFISVPPLLWTTVIVHNRFPQKI